MKKIKILVFSIAITLVVISLAFLSVFVVKHFIGVPSCPGPIEDFDKLVWEQEGYKCFLLLVLSLVL